MSREAVVSLKPSDAMAWLAFFKKRKVDTVLRCSRQEPCKNTGAFMFLSLSHYFFKRIEPQPSLKLKKKQRCREASPIFLLCCDVIYFINL